MQHGDVFSLDLSLFWEKKNANSAPANFIQLHLGELLTSKPANRQETCERKKKNVSFECFRKEHFHLQ